MTAPAPTFAVYARAMELGGSIPDPIVDLVGVDATPYQVLRQLVPRAERRERGTFFTSSATANSLWKTARDTLPPGAVIVDPACGAGDLLIPALEQAKTSALSSVVFRACDIDEDFARVAAARLRDGLPATLGRVEEFTRDFMADSATVADATHVVLNPPFVPVAVDESWASGQVNAAALFTVHALKAMQPGARLLAVLPDVLRSGSRYSAWRALVEKLAGLNHIEPLDVFDKHADVHVFTMDVTVGEQRNMTSWRRAAVGGLTLADFADVRVGPVVPHRDPEEGPLYRYVTARSLAADGTLHRRFEGRKEHGPFVLVNRTSRPGESKRIRARLWSSTDDVAVENHLLIVAPKDRSLATCHDIIRTLSSAAAAEFLDERIRCRHLTVRALNEIPWQL